MAILVGRGPSFYLRYLSFLPRTVPAAVAAVRGKYVDGGVKQANRQPDGANDA
jgi:hypothetical protein